MRVAFAALATALFVSTGCYDIPDDGPPLADTEFRYSDRDITDSGHLLIPFGSIAAVDFHEGAHDVRWVSENDQVITLIPTGNQLFLFAGRDFFSGGEPIESRTNPASLVYPVIDSVRRQSRGFTVQTVINVAGWWALTARRPQTPVVEALFTQAGGTVYLGGFPYGHDEPGGQGELDGRWLWITSYGALNLIHFEFKARDFMVVTYVDSRGNGTIFDGVREE